jgi:E3 ubiquitin-protein ligase makorin
MPTNSLEKEQVLREYKSNCASKPCKHFDIGRLGSCPFGSDCFFAHTSINGKDIKSRDKSMQQLYEIRQRDRNERNSNDIGYITDMLMMMGLQRHLVRRERERGDNGRWERDDDDDDDDDVEDEDDDILSFSDIMTGLLLDNPDLLDIFSSFGDN